MINVVEGWLEVLDESMIVLLTGLEVEDDVLAGTWVTLDDDVVADRCGAEEICTLVDDAMAEEPVGRLVDGRVPEIMADRLDDDCPEDVA